MALLFQSIYFVCFYKEFLLIYFYYLVRHLLVVGMLDLLLFIMLMLLLNFVLIVHMLVKEQMDIKMNWVLLQVDKKNIKKNINTFTNMILF